MPVKFALSTPPSVKDGFENLSMTSAHLPRVGDHVMAPYRRRLLTHIYEVVAVLHFEDQSPHVYVVESSVDAAVRARRAVIDANEEALDQWGRELEGISDAKKPAG
jgi:hypothetical protein